ncbi:MAG: ABC transporter ATP-binding protein [Caldilineaceae bacterium]
MFPYSPHPHQEPMAGALAVNAVNVSGAYEHQAAPALKGVSLQAPVGSRIALVGPNGAGKSTLLKLIAGLLPLQQGSIALFGHAVGICRHRVAYLAQRSEIDWRFPMTVRRLVGTGRYVHLGWFKRLGATDRQIVDSAMAQLQIEHLAERQIGQLSGGQQQRTLLARTLAQEADLLLLDEPLNAVDVETRALVTQVLDALHSQGKTVLIATHDLGRLEKEFDGALYLCEGREVQPPPGSFTGIPVGAVDYAQSATGGFDKLSQQTATPHTNVKV